MSCSRSIGRSDGFVGTAARTRDRGTGAQGRLSQQLSFGLPPCVLAGSLRAVSDEELHNPHDRFFKRTFGRLTEAAEFTVNWKSVKLRTT